MAKKMQDFSGLGGFDPSQLDPAWMANFMQAMQRLPKAQKIKLQQMVQKAMSGQDVTRDMEFLQRTLPPQIRDLLNAAPGMAEAAQAAEAQTGEVVEAQEDVAEEMDLSEAQKIVQQAAAEGKISKEEAEALLAGQGSPAEEKKSGLGKLWSKIKGN